jgi:hypothetical protein
MRCHAEADQPEFYADPMQKRWEEFQMMIATPSSETQTSLMATATNVKEPEYTDTPVVHGADALLRTSLASVLWYWPLGQRPHEFRRSQSGQRRSRRWR